MSLNHPAFWSITADPSDDSTPLGFVGAVMTRGLSTASHREWAYTKVIVEEGYESPYRFGRMLRLLVQDDAAPIFRYNPANVYFAFSLHTGLAAFYEPARRQPEP